MNCQLKISGNSTKRKTKIVLLFSGATKCQTKIALLFSEALKLKIAILVTHTENFVVYNMVSVVIAAQMCKHIRSICHKQIINQFCTVIL